MRTRRGKEEATGMQERERPQGDWLFWFAQGRGCFWEAGLSVPKQETALIDSERWGVRKGHSVQSKLS